MMRNFAIIAMCVLLSACASNNYQDDRVIRTGGFEIEKGQHMHDFFDDFEEPMQAKYIGNRISKWTYYVDNTDGNNKIVRYCELNNYKINNLCRLNVEFSGKYVSNAYSNCRS